MNKKMIMTPGPTEIHEEVRMSMAQPITNPDLDMDFFELYRDTTEKLKKLMNTKNDVVILSGEGILGLEAACASLIEGGDRVLCIDNGIFGRGFGDFVKMYGGECVYFSADYRRPLDVLELEKFLEKDNNFKFCTVVHCETPSGILNPVKEISKLLKKHSILTVVDAVSSIGGEPLDVDDWQIDVALGGSQKCLSAAPGLTFVSISEEAWDKILNRNKPIVGYYCNLSLWKDWYKNKAFPYTQPISDIYGLDTAVKRLLNDTDRYERHSRIGNAVRKALINAGIELYPLEGWSNTVTAFIPPDETTEKEIRNHLLRKYNVMIAGAFDVLDGKVLRIGHMGENCREAKIYITLKYLDKTLRELGVTLKAQLHKEFVYFLEE